MPALATRERRALCDLLDAVGPDAPTLCEGWTTYDLAAHLVLREGSPIAALGFALPTLEGVANRGMDKLKGESGYPELVDRVRNGPPRLSPFRVGKVDRAANTLEYFIHHEDVRRARPGWQARDLDSRDQQSLWARLAAVGPMMARRARVGIELVRTDAPGVRRIKPGEPTVVVRGLPSELALLTHGRGAVADVECGGDPEARERFRHADLGA